MDKVTTTRLMTTVLPSGDVTLLLDASQRPVLAFDNVDTLEKFGLELVRQAEGHRVRAEQAAVDEADENGIPEGYCDVDHPEHDYRQGDLECRRCGADLGEWES